MKNIVWIISILLFLGSCKKSNTLENQDEDIDEGIENDSIIKPNILLIIADDMGLDACPLYSEGEIQPAMPNLEALALDGITFDNAWAYPVCSPTRASIITGKYGSRTGILSVNQSYLSKTEQSIQQYINAKTDSAYAQAVIGKWHLSKNNDLSAPNDFGIEHFAGFMGGAMDDYSNWNLVQNGKAETCQIYNTTKITDLSIDWIKNQSKPWFCWLAYSAPHTPFHYPPSDLHQQNEAENTELSMYLAMIESLDHEMGRLLNSMDEDTRENTIIIFLGDNGTDKNVLQLPYRGRKAKGSIYQGGINVPLIVSGKGVSRKNVRDDSQISSADFFATIADIAGVGISQYQDSYSFKPLFTNEAIALRSYNFSEVDHGDDYRYTISDGIYKLISNNDKDDELYNLIDDPYETTDLYSSTNSDDIQAKQQLISEADKIINE
ncbi:sulfatase-like hydrolase/transferase [Saccharicrinis aurantiacus]|uniref:sulfatase-like hydrolase/transferase n=1 Tax=Saccharicrinis aurantiacus TaxID=1849719 RepID=UPI0008380E02|nr:sulfatase-like hydrolase/transferase [Saccharicrinis aurantiacus]